MGAQLATVGLLVIFPVLAAVIGSVLPAFRRPGTRLISGVQHFAAGAVLAAIALDVLPGLQKQGNLWAASIGFAFGVILLLGLRQVESHPSHGIENGSPHGLPIGLLVAVGLDLFVDGILVGLSVATLGKGQGVLLTIALTMVVLPLALSVTVELTARGIGTARSALIPPLLTLALVAGALGGVIVLGSAPAAVIAGILALGLAALLYLAAEELLVEAHESRDTPLLAAMFFVGFFVLYLLDAAL